MVSRRWVPVLDGARFGWWLRLAGVAVLAALLLAAGGDRTSAAEGVTPAAACCADRAGSVSNVARPLTRARLDPASQKSVRASAPAKQDEPEPADSVVTGVLDRGRALLGRYDTEQVLLAVVVGALVQIVGLVVFRAIGTFLGLVTRVLAWGLGAAVALALLNGDAGRLTEVDEAVRWLGRLSDLVT
jgi:hypothetical protein